MRSREKEPPRERRKAEKAKHPQHLRYQERSEWDTDYEQDFDDNNHNHIGVGAKLKTNKNRIIYRSPRKSERRTESEKPYSRFRSEVRQQQAHQRM